MKHPQKISEIFSTAGKHCALAFVLACCLFFPQQPNAAVIADGDYLIQMADSDLAVVSSGASVLERVSLGRDLPSGVWRFEHLGNNYYKITAPRLVMVLDSAEGKKYNGVPIIIYPWHGGKNQRWKVIAKGECFALVNQETGLALDLKGNTQRAGAVFQGYAENTSRGQLFRLTPKGKQNPPAKPHTEQTRDAAVKSFSNGPAAR